MKLIANVLLSFIMIVLGLVGLFGLILLGAVIGGTIVWWLWPHVIPVVFPALVAKGYLIPVLNWTTAVALTWLLGILFSKRVKNSSNKK